jgi:NADH-quinone oxidoreductase subunit L
MVLAMGVGAFGAGIFHLYTHAFFKALLFLGSGAVIHALHGEQDIRNMGGLKRALPITYWTFLIGSLAIAGVPGLAGFFSKDEILFETFAHGHTILWVVGVLTSLLTATYMFRLVFLTFHGERREGAIVSDLDASGHDAGASLHDHGAISHQPGAVSHHADHGSHQPGTGSHPPGAGSHLHDAPPAMALALIVLALGSVLAGYVGVPRALGGSNELGAWLDPSFEARSVTTLAGEQVGTPGEPGATGAGGAGGASEERLELTLMVVSSIVALLGIGIAAFIWLKRREIADKAARTFHGVYTLLLNKYYVDEIYDAAIVQPIRIVSQEGLWRGVDVHIIDGAVNGTASIVEGGSSLMRRLQTGSVRAYAGSLLIGVVLILGYYLWR